MKPSSLVSKAALGALDGALATLPMTAVMALGNQATSPGSAPRLRSLPPTRVGKKLARILGLSSTTDRVTRAALGCLAHLGVGALSGVMYRSVRGAVGPAAPVNTAGDYAAGAAFGTAVWASGYLGVLPMLGLVERPHRAPRGQTATMLLAHWVYGAALTALSRKRERG